MKQPRFLVIDLKDVIDAHISLNTLYDVYNKFPLQEMISSILSVPSNLDYSEKLNIEVEDRFSDVLDDFDYDDPNIHRFFEEMELFLDNLAILIDENISRKLKPTFNYEEYVFEKWIDNTSILLKWRIY